MNKRIVGKKLTVFTLGMVTCIGQVFTFAYLGGPFNVPTTFSFVYAFHQVIYWFSIIGLLMACGFYFVTNYIESIEIGLTFSKTGRRIYKLMK